MLGYLKHVIERELILYYSSKKKNVICDPKFIQIKWKLN